MFQRQNKRSHLYHPEVLAQITISSGERQMFTLVYLLKKVLFEEFEQPILATRFALQQLLGVGQASSCTLADEGSANSCPQKLKWQQMQKGIFNIKRVIEICSSVTAHSTSIVRENTFLRFI
jgi:hypothetical protein